jgi:hypothetical protein
VAVLVGALAGCGGSEESDRTATAPRAAPSTDLRDQLEGATESRSRSRARSSTRTHYAKTQAAGADGARAARERDASATPSVADAYARY